MLLFAAGVGIFIYPALSNYLAQREQKEVIEEYDADKVLPGNTLQFTAKITLRGEVFGSHEVDWSISSEHDGNTTIDTSGLLTVASDESNTEMTIRASLKTKPDIYAEKTVITGATYEDIDTITPGSMATVRIDGIDWYVLAKNEGKVLIWPKEPVETSRQFDASTVVWKDSELRTYLNGNWLNDTNVLKEKAVQTDITTRVWNTDTFKTTQDKVFLLSEADLFGTYSSGQSSPDARDYTYNSQVLVPNVEMRKFTQVSYCWLRSPYSSNYIAAVTNAGDLTYGTMSQPYNNYGVRPALWITMP